jgi:hypothetical protein
MATIGASIRRNHPQLAEALLAAGRGVCDVCGRPIGNHNFTPTVKGGVHLGGCSAVAYVREIRAAQGAPGGQS